MNCIWMPSLEHIALTKICIRFWNNICVQNLATDISFRKFDSKTKRIWENMEDKVMCKVTKLLLPDSVKKKLFGVVKPIGLQIFRWIENYYENCHFSKDLPDEFCWTPQGTIDKKKTAETLVKNNSLDITTRYELACMYCLESDIKMLWNEMPENLRESFYTEDDTNDMELHSLVDLWTCDVMEEMSESSSIESKEHTCTSYEYAFETSAYGNVVATEHFFQKLTPEERERSLVKMALDIAHEHIDRASDHNDLHTSDFIDVFCFLLSQMNKEQQAEIYKKYACQVLTCLLDWPRQSLFIEAAENLWLFLSKSDFYYLLFNIIKKVEYGYGYRDYNYQKLFREFWKLSPLSYRKYTINNSRILKILSSLIEIEDWESIALVISVIKEATLEEKEFLIFSNGGRDICKSLIFSNKCDLLSIFIDVCISSEEKMIKLRKCFEKYKKYSVSTAQTRDDSDSEERHSTSIKFYKFLDNLIKTKYKKRSMEEGDSHPAKRLNILTVE